MLVGEVMTHGVDFVSRSDTVLEVAQKMLRDNVGLLPVFDGNFAVGVVTDRDIALRSVARGLDPAKTRISEVMTPEVYFCNTSDSLERAAEVMRERQVRRLLVKNEYAHVTGIVSLADIARSGEAEVIARILRSVTTPPQPQW